MTQELGTMTTAEYARHLAETNGGTWGSHRRYSVADWQYEVANNDTRLGYWEWVAHQIDAEEA